MRTIFKKKSLQDLFDKQGYVIVPSFLKESIVAELTNLHHKTFPENVETAFHCTLYNESDSQKKTVNDEVKRVVQPIADECILNYKALVADFPIKGPQTDGDVAMHQDWTFVNEKKHTSLNIWIPLVDVDDKNGAYFVLKGSHRLKYTIRGSHIDLPCRDVKYKVNYDNMCYLPMKAGDAIIYDHRLMHRTPPNTTDKNRIALSFNLIPSEAKPIHYYKHADSGKIELLEIDFNFFTKYTYNPNIKSNSLPEGTKSLGFVEDYQYVCFTENQVLPLCENKTFIQKVRVGISSLMKRV